MQQGEVGWRNTGAILRVRKNCQILSRKALSRLLWRVRMSVAIDECGPVLFSCPVVVRTKFVINLNKLATTSIISYRVAFFYSEDERGFLEKTERGF